MSGRPLRADAERNRLRVLEAAAESFALNGLGASVDDIARRAGVGMGTLYRRFPTKDALINELVGHLIQQLADLAHGHIDDADGAGLEGFIADAATLLAERHGFLRRIWDRNNEPSHIARQSYRDAVDELVARARRAKRISPAIDASDVSLALWSIQGVITQTLSDRDGRARRRFVQILLAGLRAGPADTAGPALTLAELDETRS